jgi:hypothetical protein
MRKESWQAYRRGKNIGKKDSQGDAIVRDEAHHLGARMTVKQGQGHISVSCTISGWMDHTRFFDKLPEALYAYDQMKPEVVAVLKTISSAKSNDLKAWEAISEFVTRFP